MKLIILGNGFDLNHNYKTSFNDFRAYLIKSKIEENEILVNHIDQLIPQSDNKDEIQWNNFEKIIGHRLNPSIKFKNMKGLDIVSLIEQFTEKFHAYILNLLNTNNFKINQNLTKEFNDVSSILTFNYTPFYSHYLEDFNDKNIFHIHGEMKKNNLPIIGYYYDKIAIDHRSLDYSIKYGDRLIHKPALALKQNEINLDSAIKRYILKWKEKISEIVVMGYSFGESDSHIFNILNTIMITQTKELNVPLSKAKELNIVKFKIYSYNDDDSKRIIEKIKYEFSKLNRRFTINITGVGFSSQKKDLILFELIKY